MVKKRRVDKKKKDKSPKAPPVNAFDLDFTNEIDLKRYISKLEKEIELMRKDLDSHSTNSYKLMQFLETRKNATTIQLRKSFVNSCVGNDHIERLKNLPERRKENSIVNHQGKIEKKLESALDDFVARSALEAHHLDKEHSLKKELIDKDNELDYQSFLSKMAMADTKHAFHGAVEELDRRNNRKLEDVIRQNVTEILKTNEDFNADRIRMLTSIWGINDPINPLKDSYVSELRQMQDFFQEISLNNNELIKILRTKLACLLTEDKKVRYNLKQTELQNMELKKVQEPDLDFNSPTVKNSAVLKDSEKDKDIEKLKFKNDLLRERLRVVTENFENLKKQLIGNIQKIYQRADFKAYILEEILSLKHKIENKKLEDESYKQHLYEKRKQRQEMESKRFNVVSVTLENSDTLFVPPVYHEFWDASVKKRFSKKS